METLAQEDGLHLTHTSDKNLESHAAQGCHGSGLRRLARWRSSTEGGVTGLARWRPRVEKGVAGVALEEKGSLESVDGPICKCCPARVFKESTTVRFLYLDKIVCVMGQANGSQLSVGERINSYFWAITFFKVFLLLIFWGRGVSFFF